MTTHEVVLPMFSAMAKLPEKKYRTLVADPPWPNKLRPPHRSHQVAPYGLMEMHELMSMPVGLWAADDAHLYLWTLNSHMVEAHQVAKAWGFEPKTVLTWVKGRIESGRLIQHIGMGAYLRNSTEHVIFCVRGSLAIFCVRGSLAVRNHDVPTAFIAPRLEHSEKPAAFYDLVAKLSPSPYLDVFARTQRFVTDGPAAGTVWETFGNEAFNFGTEEPASAFLAEGGA